MPCHVAFRKFANQYHLQKSPKHPISPGSSPIVCQMTSHPKSDPNLLPKSDISSSGGHAVWLRKLIPIQQGSRPSVVTSLPYMQIEGVDEVHDLHVWALTPGIPLLAVHLNLKPGAIPSRVLALATQLCRDKKIEHSTIQLICHGDECCGTNLSHSYPSHYGEAGEEPASLPHHDGHHRHSHGESSRGPEQHSHKHKSPGLSHTGHSHKHDH